MPSIQRAKGSGNTYVLKLLMYLILGSFWLRVAHGSMNIPIPAGLLIGLFFANHDHFKIDRKTEYVILLVGAAVGFWSLIGLVVSF